MEKDKNNSGEEQSKQQKILFNENDTCEDSIIIDEETKLLNEAIKYRKRAEEEGKLQRKKYKEQIEYYKQLSQNYNEQTKKYREQTEYYKQLSQKYREQKRQLVEQRRKSREQNSQSN